ncbi:unnamed protein product, partial [Iphiclides podalirius]
MKRGVVSCKLYLPHTVRRQRASDKRLYNRRLDSGGGRVGLVGSSERSPGRGRARGAWNVDAAQRPVRVNVPTWSGRALALAEGVMEARGCEGEATPLLLALPSDSIRLGTV